MFKVEEIQLETGMQSWFGSWVVLPGDGGEIINRGGSSSRRAWSRGMVLAIKSVVFQTRLFLCCVSWLTHLFWVLSTF